MRDSYFKVGLQETMFAKTTFKFLFVNSILLKQEQLIEMESIEQRILFWENFS